MISKKKRRKTINNHFLHLIVLLLVLLRENITPIHAFFGLVELHNQSILPPEDGQVKEPATVQSLFQLLPPTLMTLLLPMKATKY